MDTAKMVNVFVKIRDKRQEKRKEWEDEDKRLAEQQDRVSAELLRYLNTNNMDSVRTEKGTFFRQEKVVPTASDWDTFYKWVAQTDGFDFLEKRIKRAEVTKYMETHEGTPPPGVSVYREYEVRVRRGD
jgi:hypothetical protein